jgi:hypothetical protein
MAPREKVLKQNCLQRLRCISHEFQNNNNLESSGLALWPDVRFPFKICLRSLGKEELTALISADSIT